MKNQHDIELKYSRKHIRARIKEDVNPEHDVFQSMVKEVTKYRSGQYYPQKQKRVNAIQLTSHEIVSELLAVVLPIKEVSPIQAVAALLGKHLGFDKLLDSIKTAAEIIAVCEKTKIYDIYHSQDFENETGTLGIRPNYSLNKDTLDYINQTKYLPPMIETPKDWTSNTNGGNFIGSGSIILGSINHHDYPQSLDVINQLQKIEWSLCPMVDFKEKAKKPLDTHDKKIQFNQLESESTKVYEELIEQGNKFYFVWKYDSRGRMYSQGYHCNLQSTEYKKSILEFNKKELIK
jgi:hypothetical protein